jgi:hypothetical protein
VRGPEFKPSISPPTPTPFFKKYLPENRNFDNFYMIYLITIKDTKTFRGFQNLNFV